ncbi:MAG: hypothetical protein KDA42_11530 [Planctomycetales bacterium]|nr:hypothetical protein [Planctomycetales bacterium]
MRAFVFGIGPIELLVIAAIGCVILVVPVLIAGAIVLIVRKSQPSSRVSNLEQSVQRRDDIA